MFVLPAKIFNIFIFQWLNYFIGVKDELIETFKTINGISNYGRHFLKYFSLNCKFTFKANFKN